MSLSKTLKTAGENFCEGIYKGLMYKGKAAQRVYQSIKDLNPRGTLKSLYDLALKP
jgi:hypothetical protein